MSFFVSIRNIAWVEMIIVFISTTTFALDAYEFKNGLTAFYYYMICRLCGYVTLMTIGRKKITAPSIDVMISTNSPRANRIGSPLITRYRSASTIENNKSFFDYVKSIFTLPTQSSKSHLDFTSDWNTSA